MFQLLQLLQARVVARGLRSLRATTSKWVTKRTECGPMALARTPFCLQGCDEGRRASPSSLSGRSRCWSARRRDRSRRPGRRRPRRADVHWRDLREPAGISFSAIRPAAARMPAWRMPPPRALRKTRASRDVLAAADQHGADRRAEAFRQAEHDGVEAAGQLGDGHVEGGGGVEDARAVQMDGQTGVRVRRPRSPRAQAAA